MPEVRTDGAVRAEATDDKPRAEAKLALTMPRCEGGRQSQSLLWLCRTDDKPNAMKLASIAEVRRKKTEGQSRQRKTKSTDGAERKRQSI